MDPNLNMLATFHGHFKSVANVAGNADAMSKAAYTRMRRDMQPSDVFGEEQKLMMCVLAGIRRVDIDGWEAAFIEAYPAYGNPLLGGRKATQKRPDTDLNEAMRSMCLKVPTKVGKAVNNVAVAAWKCSEESMKETNKGKKRDFRGKHVDRATFYQGATVNAINGYTGKTFNGEMEHHPRSDRSLSGRPRGK